jgi:hypothetical protein
MIMRVPVQTALWRKRGAGGVTELSVNHWLTRDPGVGLGVGVGSGVGVGVGVGVGFGVACATVTSWLFREPNESQELKMPAINGTKRVMATNAVKGSRRGALISF